MKKLFKPLNDWYDSLYEPWRFLLLLAMVAVWTAGLATSPQHHPIIIVLAIVILFFQTFWALSRE